MAGLLEFLGRMQGDLLRAREQAMQPLQEQAGQAHAQAFRGILNNPDLGVAGAGNLGLLLQSADPEARQMGRELVGQYLVGRSPLGALQRRIAEQQLSNEKVGAQQRATEFGRRMEEYQYGVSQRPAEERRAGLQERTAQLQLDAAQFDYNQRLLEAAKPQPVLPYGDAPKGYFPAQGPAGIEYIPQPGTEAYNKAQEGVRELEGILKDIQLFQTVVEKAGPSGTEFVGPVASNLKFLRGNVLSRVAKLRGLGVLQPAELENLEAQLPDPTGLARNYAAYLGMLDPTGTTWDYQRQTIQEPYNAMRQLFEERLQKAYQTYWYVDKTAGALPDTAR